MLGRLLVSFARSYGRAPLLLIVGSAAAYLAERTTRPRFETSPSLVHYSRCQEAEDSAAVSPDWELLSIPDRGKVSTHVIFGTLMQQSDLIERYDVYQSKDSSTSQIVRGVVKVGGKLDGHPGVVHGGILALLVDDVLGFGFYAIGVAMAMTANLNVNYLAPVPANTEIVIDAFLERQEGRKLFWTVVVADADDPEHVYCNATSLYIIPRHAYDSSS